MSQEFNDIIKSDVENVFYSDFDISVIYIPDEGEQVEFMATLKEDEEVLYDEILSLETTLSFPAGRCPKIYKGGVISANGKIYNVAETRPVKNYERVVVLTDAN